MALPSEYRFHHLVLIVAGLFATTVLLGVAGYHVPVFRPVLSVAFLAIGIGGLFMQSIGINPELRADWFVYAVGCSLLVVMAVGFVLNLALPTVGVERPLSPVPLTAGITLTTAGLAVFVQYRRQTPALPVPDGDWIRDTFPDARRTGWQAYVPLLLPLVAVLAVTHLNAANDTTPILIVLVVIAVLPLVAVLRILEDRYMPLTVWGMGLAVLYHKSLWLGYLYGGHASVITIWKQGHWSLTFETLATNAILMPTFAHLSGIDILTQMKVIMPLFVAVLPVALFVTFRRYTTTAMAFLGAALFVFAHPFYYQYPSVARASFPVIYLGLLGTAISDRHHHVSARRVLAVLFAVGIIVSHYGTSYYIMFGLLGAVALLPLLTVLDGLVQRVMLPESMLVEDESVLRKTVAAVSSRGLNIVGLNYVAFYIVSVISWYFYVAGGSKFDALIEHVLNAYQSFFVETGGQGSTATRLQTDYGTLSIQYSKYLYVLLALLAGIGLAVVVVRRLSPYRETRFDDEYIAVSAMLFLLFGATFAVSGEWGGGRPMMIVLSFNAVFAVVAAVALGQAMWGSLEGVLHRLSTSTVRGVRNASGHVSGEAACAVILAAFFLLNSGVMAALVYGGQAPSNVPSTDIESADPTADIETHVWLADHRDESEQIYGDRLARAQTTDWMNGEIAARSDRSPYRFKKKYFFSALNDSELESGYVLMMKHNVRDGRVEVNYITARSIEHYALHLDSRHKVYSNGDGNVYFTDETAQRIYRP